MDTESEVRDFIKSRLHLLEPGLVLANEEVHIRDKLDSDGRIDILARDAKRRRVIIEVKLHRSASRSGMQELAKYVRLFQETCGLTPGRLRCIVVAADWSELHAAFTTLKRTFPCPVTGFKFRIGPSGEPVDFEEVLPRQPAPPITFAPRHFLLLVRPPHSVDSLVQRVSRTFKAIGLNDYVIFLFERLVGSMIVDYLYVVTQAVGSELAKNLAAATGSTIEPDGTSTTFGPWEYAICSLINKDGKLHDQLECASPVVLVKTTMKCALAETLRFGRFSEVPDAWTDQDLMLEAIQEVYGLPDGDGPPPPSLLDVARRHHMWDFDL